MCCTQDEYVYMGVCSCHSLKCNCLYRKEHWGDMIEVHEKENITDKTWGLSVGVSIMVKLCEEIALHCQAQLQNKHY